MGKQNRLLVQDLELPGAHSHLHEKYSIKHMETGIPTTTPHMYAYMHMHIARCQLQHRRGVKSSNVASNEDWLPPVDNQCHVVNFYTIQHREELHCLPWSSFLSSFACAPGVPLQSALLALTISSFRCLFSSTICNFREGFVV